MHRLKRMRKDVGFSVLELVEYTGLSESTIRRIEDGTVEHRINRKVAEILADAFGCSVSDLFDAEELSHLGRPPLTGKPISQSLTISVTKRDGRTVETVSVTHELRGDVCRECRLEMPVTGICPDCD